MVAALRIEPVKRTEKPGSRPCGPSAALGNFLGPRIEKITVDELYRDLEQDYRIKAQTIEWAERVWEIHLKDYFGGMRACRVGTTQIGGYVEKRQAEEAAKSTINRALALLRR